MEIVPTGSPVEIIGPLEKNGAIPVNIQDQTSRALDLDFLQVLAAPTTLSANASVEDLTVDVTSTTGFVDGAVVGISTAGGDFYFGQQIGAVAGSTVTLDTPLDVAFPAGSSIFPATKAMNVNGSSTTQIFQIGPVGVATGIYIDITRIMGYIQDGNAMDDSMFGGISGGLTNGIVFRLNNDVITNYWNMKTNGQIGLLAFDANYTAKAPTGSYGFRFRNTYAGPSKHGVTLRISPGDTLELLVQDDLTGLEVFNMMAQGHYVTD
jgi:hypothetical protein